METKGLKMKNYRCLLTVYLVLILIGCTVPQMAMTVREQDRPILVPKVNPFSSGDPIIRFIKYPGKDTVIAKTEVNQIQVNQIDTASLNHWFKGLEDKIEAHHEYSEYERSQLNELVEEYRKVIVENGVLLAHFVEATKEKEQAEKKVERVYSIAADTPFIFLVVYMLIFHFPIWFKIRLLKQQIALLKGQSGK